MNLRRICMITCPGTVIIKRLLNRYTVFIRHLNVFVDGAARMLNVKFPILRCRLADAFGTDLSF